MPVFDLRVRLVPRDGAVADLLSTMDECGITRAGVAAGGVVSLAQLSAQILHNGHSEAEPDNAAVRTACAESGGRLVPWYFANPRSTGAAEAYAANAPWFRGLELSPAVHGVALTDPRTTALVDVAALAGHCVYTVCLHRPGRAASDLVALAQAYPRTWFILGHCGHIGIDAHAVDTVAAQPNIVAETSGCFTATARHALATLGPDRVLFGTEYPLQHPSVELAKYAALGLHPTHWRAVAWDNAHRLLGEDPA